MVAVATDDRGRTLMRCRKYPRCQNQYWTRQPGAANLAYCNVQGPKFMRRIKNFTVALIAHAVAGMPTCTQEEITARYEICAACPWFKEERCTHRDCGCAISGQKSYLSKLAWKDQHCPIKKW